MKVRPFKGIRPPRELVEEVASRPYDVLNSEEARVEAEGNEKSLYHIIRPEIDFPVGTDEHSPEVYEKAVENFAAFRNNGWLVQDEEPHYYIYAQTMDGRTQYGIVLGASVEDYMNSAIKKHELTRKDKEEDRMKHVRINNANIEPVFLAFPDNEVLEAVIAKVSETVPEYDFVAPDGFGHKFWVIEDKQQIETISAEFEKMPAMYIADGHHRSAAAALVGHEKAQQNSATHTGHESYNYFLAVAFPASHLRIIDYNRLVTDLNGYSPAEFLEKLGHDFVVEDKGEEIYKPAALHNFSLYLEGRWYSLIAREGTYNDSDPIGVLDVTVSSELILQKLLNIGDLRTSKRIDFVGGIRGLVELKRRCDSGEMAVGLALYPVSMKQLMDIADSGAIMPPKTTWFEPKLRSGLVIHSLAD